MRMDPATVPLTGTRLIEASAGTGKTYTIASLFLRLVLSGYPVNEILVVTFTEVATAELKDRLRARLREALSDIRKETMPDTLLVPIINGIPGMNFQQAARRLQTALSGFDGAAVMTIHGFCRRMLQENAFESGVLFDSELQTEPSALYEEIARDVWALEVYPLPALWMRFLKESNVSPEKFAAMLRQVAGNPDRIRLPEKFMEASDAAEFDRLYGEARRIWTRDRTDLLTLLTTHPGVNRKSYTKTNLMRWLENTALYFSSESPSALPGEKDLRRFCRTALAEKALSLKGAPAPPDHPFFDICERLCRFVDRWLPAFRRRFLEKALCILARRKKELGVRFFDDLISDLDRALAGSGGALLARKIRKRFRAALIDEFQDTDQAQYRIFRTVYQGSGGPFFLIGDPKQSIYGFRGADVFTYLQAVDDADEAPYSLDINWRSDPSLIQAVNTLFDADRVSRPFWVKDIRFFPALPREGATEEFYADIPLSAAFEFLFVARNDNMDAKTGLIKKEWMDAHLPLRVAVDIRRLVSGNAGFKGRLAPIGPGDVAVLVRTNHQARRMQAALRRCGLPCVITGSDTVFQSAEAVELWQVLQAVLNPVDDVFISNALATDLFGLSGNDIEKIRGDDALWTWWVNRFRDWHRLWHEAGFMRMLGQLFAQRVPHRSGPLLMGLLCLVDGERRVTNFQHLSELLHAAAFGRHLGPTGLFRWAESRIFGQAEEGDATELRLESDARAVQIVTIHKSKGLQYPVVYAPYLWDGDHSRTGRPPVVCHDPSDRTRSFFDLGSDRLQTHIVLARSEEMAENLRLLYVALTRARHACRVVWGAANAYQYAALGYLLHAPQAGDTPEAIAGEIVGLTDADLLKDLNALAMKAAGAVSIRSLTDEDAAGFVPLQIDGPKPVRRTVHRHFVKYRRIESFSGLVSEFSRPASPEEDIGMDHDQRVAMAVDTVTGQENPDRGERIPLADFDRGATAGTFFHAVYEHMDFAGAAPSELYPLVAEKLTAFGFQADRWTEICACAVAETLFCELDNATAGLMLAKVPANQRLNELEFVFPVKGGIDGSDVPITADRMAAVFRSHARAPMPPDYPERLAGLRFADIEGYLKGFIDLVFQFENKWYLVDYKSNYIGDRVAHYGPVSLLKVMTSHHYFLQYHLYTLALHRFLRFRVPGYDYDTHFGGVYYLFIRGMSRKTGPDFGVFADRPSKALITALSKLFGKD